MMAINIFNRLFGSQGGPEIKVEANSDEIVPRNESNSYATQEEDNGRETPYQTDFEGFGDEGLEEEKPVIAPISTEKPKKKKKKRKKKKQINGGAPEDLEVDTPQLDSSPQHNSSSRKLEPAINGHLEEPFPHEGSGLEIPRLEKQSRKSNGKTSKRKRSPESYVAEKDVTLEDEAREASAQVSQGPSLGECIKSIYPAKAGDGLADSDLAEAENDVTPQTEPVIQDLPISNSPECSPERSRAKKSRSRRISKEQESVIEPAEIINISSAITQLLARAPIFNKQQEALEDNLAISSQLRRDSRSISHADSVNGADTEEEAQEEAPKRPSKKSLGKRKAIDPLLRSSNKKQKHGKGKKSSSHDLRTFGFVPSEEASNSRSGSAISPTLLTDIAGKVWEENNRVSQEPELPSHSHTIAKSPGSSWNAINNPVEPDEIDDDRSLFVSKQETTNVQEPEASASKVGQRKPSPHSDEIQPLESTPSLEARPTRAKSTSKTPKKPKTPKTPMNKVIEAQKATFSKGRHTAEEFNALKAAVESYREHYDLTDFQLNERIHADAKDKFAAQMWTEICDEVPEIARRTVMNTCRRNYYNFHRGPWKSSEDEELKRAHEEYPGKWKMIGEIMNRFPEDVRDRWRNYLVCGDTMKIAGWELEEEKRLRAAVRQCIQETRQLSRFDNGQILDEESLIDWGKVSALMDRTRSRIQCRDKWTKLKDREDAAADDPVAQMPISETWRMEAAALEARLFSANEKLTLLRAIRESGAAREGKIPWQTLKAELDGKGQRMAWKYCFRKLRESVPDQSMEFTALVNYLVDAFEQAAPNEPDGFDLPIEILASRTNEKRTRRRRQRALEDDGEPASSAAYHRTRGRKQAQKDDTVDAAADGSRSRRQSLRNRMLKEGDSQETSISPGRSLSADIVDDVTQGFESIKRTPTSARKLSVRKSKRNKYLSKEKVIEDDSDEEKPDIDKVIAGGNIVDGDSASHGSIVLNEEHSNFIMTELAEGNYEDDEAGSPEQSQDEAEVVLTPHRNAEGSPDLDTPVPGASFKKKLGPPIHLDDDAVSSDGYISDIPAVRQPRMASIEL